MYAPIEIDVRRAAEVVARRTGTGYAEALARVRQLDRGKLGAIQFADRCSDPVARTVIDAALSAARKEAA